MHPSSAAGRSSASSCPAGFPTRPAARSRPLSTRPARPAPGPVRPAAGPVRPAAGPVRPATSAAAQPLGRPAPRTPAVHQPQGPACGGSRSHGPRKPVDHSRNIKATRRGPEWLRLRELYVDAGRELHEVEDLHLLGREFGVEGLHEDAVVVKLVAAAGADSAPAASR